MTIIDFITGFITMGVVRGREDSPPDLSEDLALPVRARGLSGGRSELGERVVPPDSNALNASVDEIFKPGFSTAKKVTDVSGRGIGLPVVKKKIEAIGGQVGLESSPNQGTTFRLEIPLTLAVIQTLFIEVGGKLYAIPMASIDRLVTVDERDLKGMFDYEAIVLDGEEVPVTRLDILFGSPPLPRGERARERVKQPVVVVRRGEERLGLAVDSLVSTQEVVIKPLSRIVRENRWFAGSALIGSGEVVLILDVAHLVLSKRRPGYAGGFKDEVGRLPIFEKGASL